MKGEYGSLSNEGEKEKTLFKRQGKKREGGNGKIRRAKRLSFQKWGSVRGLGGGGGEGGRAKKRKHQGKRPPASGRAVGFLTLESYRGKERADRFESGSGRMTKEGGREWWCRKLIN